MRCIVGGEEYHAIHVQQILAGHYRALARLVLQVSIPEPVRGRRSHVYYITMFEEEWRRGRVSWSPLALGILTYMRRVARGTIGSTVTISTRKIAAHIDIPPEYQGRGAHVHVGKAFSYLRSHWLSDLPVRKTAYGGKQVYKYIYPRQALLQRVSDLLSYGPKFTPVKTVPIQNDKRKTILAEVITNNA